MLDMYALHQRAEVAKYLRDSSPSKGFVLVAFVAGLAICIWIALNMLEIRGLL